MKILGLDVSTKTGWCVGDDSLSATKFPKGMFHFPPQDNRFERYLKYQKKLEFILIEHQPDYVFIENYGFANAHTLVPLVEIGTYMRDTLNRHFGTMARVHEVPPTTLKKFVSGSGVAPKAKMMMEVYRQWGVACEDDNEADALGLVQFGMAVYKPEFTYAKSRMDAVEKYRKVHSIAA